MHESTSCLRGEIHQKLTALARLRRKFLIHTAKELADRINSSRFRKLSEADQGIVLELLGMTACTDSHSKLLKGSSPNSPDTCPNCDLDSPGVDGARKVSSNLELPRTLVALLPLIQKSFQARTIGLLSLRRLLMHTESVEFLGIAHSALGEWCLQSLRSSSRDVRLAASSTLKIFMLNSASVPSDVIHHNRVMALDFLQSLWTKNDTAVQETTVMALTQIAQVCGDEELNIVLVRFVEYLGHTNPYISGLVYAELQKLAYSTKLPVSALLRPFWRTISITVVKNIQTRPSIAQRLCDLLGMEVDGLLVLIEEFALPYLVLTRKHDLILRIALIHGPTMSPFDLCTQQRNLASILSFLLGQYSTESEDSIMALLTGVSPDFKEQDLSEWVRLNPEYIACELLKAVVDPGDLRRSKAYQALGFLAQLHHRRSGHSGGSRKGDVVGSFLETNILGIITEYSNILNDLETRQPNAEKRRCLAAIGEVIKLGKSRITVALPQICACLRSAMERKELCNKAFSSWAIMIGSLKEEDIEALVDQTLAIIVRNWTLFETDTQQLAYTVVSDLLKNHTSLVRDIFDTMPSLSSIPLMTKFETELEGLKRQMDDRHGFLAFIKRLQNENGDVVEQALKELYDHLLQKQDFIYRSILREQPDDFVADLTRSLLDCCVRFNTSPSITLACVQCLGRIGCLDPNRIESAKEKKSLVVLANFAKADETVDFILHLLEHVIVKAFLSATSTRSQGFLAWAMQELLKLCDLDTTNLRPRVSGSDLNYRKWLDLSEVVRNTLTPFMNSRYTVNAIVPKTECTYPIFAPDLSHSEWLRTIVSDLLEKTASENAQLIFRICARLVKGQDISIPAFLLPFVALNVVICGTEKEKTLLVEELLEVLRQSPGGRRQIDENIRLCSESVFEILDHMSTWLQRKKKHVSMTLAKAERAIADLSVENANAHIKHVEAVLDSIPPDLISRRAIECNSYARALFHWEQYMRQVKEESENSDELFERLQEIYSQIDEPDGIEGISAQLHVLDIDQQILEHRKAGRWPAAQSWYELQLNDKPQDPDLQVNLLTCLRESGQYGRWSNLENRRSGC
jgi:serine/threonine-protein kinase ATR